MGMDRNSNKSIGARIERFGELERGTMYLSVKEDMQIVGVGEDAEDIERGRTMICCSDF